MGAYSYGGLAVKSHIQIIATHCPEIDQSGNLVHRSREDVVWSGLVHLVGTRNERKNEIAKACLLVRARGHWPPLGMCVYACCESVLQLSSGSPYGIHGDGVHACPVLSCGIQRSLWIVGLEVYINKDAHRYGVIRSPLWDKCSPSRERSTSCFARFCRICFISPT